MTAQKGPPDKHHLVKLVDSCLDTVADLDAGEEVDIFKNTMRLINNILQTSVGSILLRSKMIVDDWEHIIQRIVPPDNNDAEKNGDKKSLLSEKFNITQKIEHNWILETFIKDDHPFIKKKAAGPFKFEGIETLYFHRYQINEWKDVEPNEAKEYFIFCVFNPELKQIDISVARFIEMIFTLTKFQNFNFLYNKLLSSLKYTSRRATMEAAENFLSVCAEDINYDIIQSKYFDMGLSLILNPPAEKSSAEDEDDDLQGRLTALGEMALPHVLPGFKPERQKEIPFKLYLDKEIKNFPFTHLAVSRVLLRIMENEALEKILKNKNEEEKKKLEEDVWVFIENSIETLCAFDDSKHDMIFDSWLWTAWLRIYVLCKLKSKALETGDSTGLPTLTRLRKLESKTLEIDEIMNETEKLLMPTWEYMIYHLTRGEDVNTTEFSPRIHSDWLWSWYLTKVLNAYSIKACIVSESGLLSPNLRLEWAQNLSVVVLSQLHWCRNLDFKRSDRQGLEKFRKREKYKDVSAQELIISQVGLIEEYAYTVYGLDRDIGFRNIFLELFPFEVIMYLLKPAFRDHLFHVIQVYLLGELLLESSIGLTEEEILLWQHIGDPGKLEKRGRIGRNWVFAALFHDIGFIYDAIRQVVTSPNMPQSKALSEMFKDLRKAVTEAEKWLKKDDEYTRIMEMLGAGGHQHAGLDHGVFSALEGLALQEKLFDLEEKKADLEWAVQAIAKHNLNDVTIKCDEEHISFLLFLCDHLQEWDRPRGDYETMGQSMVFSLYQMGEESPHGESCLEYLSINGNLKLDRKGGKGLYVKFNDIRMKFFLYFKDASTGRVEPVCYWGKISLDAKKLILEGAKNQYHIIAYHPRSQYLQKSLDYKYEMDLFQDAVTGTKIGAGISDWIGSLRKINAKFKDDGRLAGIKPNEEVSLFNFIDSLDHNIAYATLDHGELYYLKLNKISEEDKIPSKWPEETFRHLANKRRPR
jgi:hypothetical protein